MPDLICCLFLQHTLETALLSASQEIELGSDNPAAMQSVVQQRDLLQSGLLSTCRELSRVTTVSHRLDNITTCCSCTYWTLNYSFFWFFVFSSVCRHIVIHTFYAPHQELERSWRDYDKLEGDVTLAKNNLLEQLEVLGSPQVGSFFENEAALL